MLKGKGLFWQRPGEVPESLPRSKAVAACKHVGGAVTAGEVIGTGKGLRTGRGSEAPGLFP